MTVVRLRHLFLIAGIGAALAGCGASTAAQAPATAEPELGPATPIEWADWGPGIFERARAEKRLILVDVGIEGCTACRDMHVETYGHADVRRRVNGSFLAVAVDADQQPDLGSKYADWGWPATIFLKGDGTQVMAVAGSRSPRQFMEILDELVGLQKAGRLPTERTNDRGIGLENADLAERCERMVERLDEVGDEHGWGGRTRVIESEPILYSFYRAHARGEKARIERALGAVRGHAKLLDPVWGGVFVAASSVTWDGIIPEKRTIHEGRALAAFAEAYSVTKDERWLRAGREVIRYLDDWMRADDGTYFSTQEDVAPNLPKGMEAVEYYRLPDAERRRHGIPPIDHGVYTDQNGVVIDALVRFFEASGDAKALESARRTADALLERRMRPGGFVSQTEPSKAVEADDRLRTTSAEGGSRLFLLPQARFGAALLALHRVTGDAKYREAARSVGEAIAPLEDRRDGGFFTTPARETDALVSRDKPYLENLEAARFLTALSVVTKNKAFRSQAERTLRYAGRKGVLRMFGPTNIATYAAALDELLSGPIEISVVGDPSDDGARALFRVARDLYEPRKVLHYEKPGRYPRKDRPAAYICTQDRCSSPVFEPEQIAEVTASFARVPEGAACGR